MRLKSLSKGLAGLLSLVLIFMLLAACGTGNETSTPNKSAEKSEGRINFGTSPIGSSMNSIANGLASVISLNSDVQTAVQPYAGVSAWLPLMDSGEVGLGVDSGPEMIWAFNGDGERGYSEPLKNIRYLVRGNFISATGLIVRKDSGIKTVADLKGKRVTSNYPGSVLAKLIVESALAANGLTWDDVNNVPVPTIVAATEALQNDRVDASFALVPSSPIMMEAHNTTGLHGLNFIDNTEPDQLDKVPQNVLGEITSRIPAAKLTIVKPTGYLQEDTIGIKYPNFMMTSSHISDEAIYKIMETLWVHYEKLHSIHPWLEEWVPDQMFDPNPQVPYHPGAVQFFKDKDLWNDEVDKIQQDLLELTK